MWKPIILDIECIVCNKSLQKINHLPRDNNCKMGKIIKVNNNNRRLRTPNWSMEEKQYLLELIKQRKDVVVTKSNNGPNHYEEKDIAWNEILRELAVKFGDKFNGSSTKKVKTQWQNMKRIAREEMALNGTMLQNYSKLSLEVCNIIETIKDGELRTENDSLNESTMTTNVEIKAELIEEDDVDQPSCSGINLNSNSLNANTQLLNETNNSNETVNQLNTSTSSISDSNDNDTLKEDNSKNNAISNDKRNVFAMTDSTSTDEANKVLNPFHRELQQYFQFTAAEKQLKMDSLKEERQVIRAMRETAELNKIIAEQKLKHVLWVKKQEMLYVCIFLSYFIIVAIYKQL